MPLVAIAILAFTSPVYTSSLIVLIGLVYSYLLMRHAFLKFTKITRLMVAVISICFFAFLLQITCIGIWLIGHDTSLYWAITISSFLITFTYTYFTPLQKPKEIPLIDSYDVLALGLSLAFVAMLLAMATLKFNGNPIYTPLSLIDGNVDDGAHLAMINDRVQYDRGVLFHSQYESRARTAPSFNSYPIGWHAANAALLRAFSPNISVGAETLYFYIGSKLFWFMVTVFLFIRFGLHACQLIIKNSRTGIFTATTILLLFVFYFLIDQYRLGFYSFFPQLMSTILLAYSLINLPRDKGRDDLPVFTFLPLVVFTVGGGLSWVLLLPVFTLAAAIPIFKHLFNKRSLDAATYSLIPIAFICILAVLTQFRLIRSAGGDLGLSFIDAINTFGNIAIYNQYLLLLVIAGLLAFFISSRKLLPRWNEATSPLLSALLVFTVIIYMVQIITVEKNTYYYYKTLNTFLYLAIPLAVCGIAVFINTTVLSPPSRYAISLLCISAIILLVGFPAGNSPTISYLSGRLGLDSAESATVYSELNKVGNGISEVNKYEFLYEPVRQSQVDIANVLMKSIPVYDKCYDTVRPSFTDGTKPKDLAEILNRACKEKDVVIITKPEFFDDFQQELAKYNLKNVTLQPLK